MKKDKVIQVVRVEPGKNPEVLYIKNELEVMQGIVGGYIETAPMLDENDKVCIVLNDEGKINKMPLNRALRNEDGEIWDIVAGTFFIVGDDYEAGEFVSLTDEQANHYKEKFHFPEMFYMMGGKIVATKIPAEWRPGMTGDDI